MCETQQDNTGGNKYVKVNREKGKIIMTTHTHTHTHTHAKHTLTHTYTYTHSS